MGVPSDENLRPLTPVPLPSVSAEFQLTTKLPSVRTATIGEPTAPAAVFTLSRDDVAVPALLKTWAWTFAPSPLAHVSTKPPPFNAARPGM
ncbi:Uncharacterised protein [Comamonas aquatica]|uniref:Uncharacterized protein n=1 Tax=Comamonas aquatica TaxID=225991 RepID=A0AA35GLZ9_9BURK|nr:Uncharacterised protein [Comamonas aquatica]